MEMKYIYMIWLALLFAGGVGFYSQGSNVAQFIADFTVLFVFIFITHTIINGCINSLKWCVEKIKQGVT